MRILAQIRNLLIATVGLKDLTNLIDHPSMPSILNFAFGPVVF